MAGNKSIYNDAIKKGHNAAWDGQWKKAADEYRRALAEFPNDHNVRAGLAQALEELGQLESALHEFTNIVKAQPNDPVPMMRIAALQEKMKKPAEAAGTLIAAAELYVAAKQMKKATEAWCKASSLEPDRTDLHQKLAELYQRDGQHSLASGEYLALAQTYRKRGDDSKARSYAEQALGIDSRNQAARALIDEMTAKETVTPPGVLNPVDEAEKAALSRLAQTVLEEAAPPPPGIDERRNVERRPEMLQLEIDALIAHAVDAQMNRRMPEAIDAYGKLLKAGIVRPEIQFNLGLLYFETMRYDEAIDMLKQTVYDKNFALASHYALGQCFRAKGKVDSAVEHFLQVVKIVDLSNVSREQADDLISVYEGLAESYAAKGDRARAEVFSKTLDDFLSSKGWEDKVGEVRRHLESLQADGGGAALAEAIEVSESDKVLEALALAQEYIRRDKWGAAGEECFRAIELAPGYLPAHVRLAEILLKQNHLAEANAKYQTLADLCIIRGDLKRADGMYRSVLKITPDDVVNRSKLIDLLIQQDRTNDALEQYLELGDTYARAGQLPKAAEKFAEGARVAARAGISNGSATMLRHRLAEMRVRQGDLKGALGVYQEIQQQSPDDERAHFYAVDLQFRLKQPDAAARDLENLVKYYQDRGEPQKGAAVLEALKSSYPNEPRLTMLLARCYHLTGDIDKAVSALDALGESQLSAGQTQAAIETIRQIVEWNPPRVEEYKKLLQALGE
ncbi:MAG: tetratricopeptide repeat protein [Chloroflexi bacterium]|nr:tetratricopeptide repeat protein [Chloroflexota bacterium]